MACRSATASIRHLKASGLERERHQERVRALKRRLNLAGLPVIENPSHIVPILVGDPVLTKRITDALLDRFAIYVQPINYPTVPRSSERLRITPQPQHSDVDMDRLVNAFGTLWAKWDWPSRRRQGRTFAANSRNFRQWHSTTESTRNTDPRTLGGKLTRSTSVPRLADFECACSVEHAARDAQS